MTDDLVSRPAAPLHDGAARTRIAEDTATSLFVEAGAGSGKTRSLVDRVATLVLRDRIPLSRIAAVTFTEKAGAELRDRLRDRFERAWRTSRRAGGEAEPATTVASDALDDLDSAAIGTLHSFAQRILTLHPIEAGLPPLISVLDEVASSVAFDERWSVLQRELLDDPDIAEPLLLALAAGVSIDDLRSLARAFGDNWDLIETRVLPAGAPQVSLPDLSRLLRRADELVARATDCADAADRFLESLAALRDWAASARAARDTGEQQAALLAAAELKWGLGRTRNWPDLAGLKQSCQQWQSDAAGLAAEFAEASLRPLAHWIASKVRRAANERAADGNLEFHDLLVLARRLLMTSRDARESLHRRFRRLLLDEAQDTDPIQIELAVRIAGGAEAAAPDPADVAVPEGSLFLVGDPKQSIYRFRRASIATYLRAQRQLGETVTLTTNFRTVEPILRWINEVFGKLIQPEPEAQPEYQPLHPHRTETGSGPAVVLLGAEEHRDKPNAAALREREADDVAAVIGQALADGWTVRDVETGTWRPVTAADIAILVPSRTSLPFLQDALDAVGIGYRAEASSLVYQAREVRYLMAAARTLADPTDRLSLVTALRSPLFGCGDDDLWAWRGGGGSFSIQATPPDPLAALPVGQALAYLGELHRRARWMAPSAVLAALIDDRRVAEVAAATLDAPRARDTWRRLRFVVDQARAWSETAHGGLRAYVAWAARQADETARVAEAVLPETDVDAVRIMTVHAAKGLEFPVVVLSGMSSAPQGRRGVQLLWPPGGGYAVKLTKHLQTNDFSAAAPVDEQMDALERRRLLYVATTRARDHLVVSLHRKPAGKGSGRTNAQLLAQAGAADVSGVTTWASRPARHAVAAHPQRAAPPPDWESWLRRITAARRTSERPAAVTASGLEGTDPEVVFADPEGGAGRAKGPRDLELPPWTKGRYGTAIGRAVHAVLQSVDLGAAASSASAAAGSGSPPPALAIGATVSGHCLVEGVAEYAGAVAGLVRSALSSSLVARAALRPHWRESWVATTRTDGVVLEGIVDLIYREDDGTLMIVDYKTDAVPVAALPSRTAFYRPQLQAYARALHAATAAPVTAALLFLHPTGPAVAVPVPLDSG